MNLENQNIQYKLKMDNKTLGVYPNKFLAESAIQTFDENIKSKIKLVPVTGDGKELIFG